MMKCGSQGLSQGWKEEDLGLCEQRAGRIVQIMRVLVQQFDVLETMQPQGFQDFSKFSIGLTKKPERVDNKQTSARDWLQQI